MNVKVNYLVLGIFVLVLGMGLIYGIYWFSKVSDSAEYDLYRVYFSESVSGLSEKSSVKYNGVKVGFVDKIEIDHVNLRQIILTLQIASDTPITDETYATITSQGITGLAYIGLKTLIPFGNKIKAQANEPYPVIKSSPSLFVEIDQAINQVTLNLKSLASKVEGVIDDENQRYFKNMLKSFDEIATHLATKMHALDENFERIDLLIVEFSKVAVRMPQFINTAENTLVNFGNMSKSVNKSTHRFNETMNNTSRLVTDLNQQLIPLMSKTLEQLDNTLSGLDNLSRDLQENPSMLIRGKADPKFGPGESR